MPEWDACVAKWPDCTVFHSAGWARVLSATYGYDPCFVVSGGEREAPAVLPLMGVGGLGQRRRGVSLPFTDVCEALAPDAGTHRALLEAALELGRARRWQAVEVRGGRPFLGDVPAWGCFHEHVLDLTPGPERLWSALKGPVRTAVRKARADGVECRIATDADAALRYYRLHCATRRRHGVPPQPIRFFRHIQQHIVAAGHGAVVEGWREGRLAASAVFLRFGRRAVYKFGASDWRQREQRPSNLVMWEAIRWHAEQGLEQLSFGRTDIGEEGLRRFKMGWGARERMAEYFRWELPSGRPLRRESVGPGLSPRLFRRLPVWALRLIGEVAYRYMG